MLDSVCNKNRSTRKQMGRRERTGEDGRRNAFLGTNAPKEYASQATATATATLALRVKSSREFNNAQPSLIARGGAGVRTRVARLYVY